MRLFSLSNLMPHQATSPAAKNDRKKHLHGYEEDGSMDDDSVFESPSQQNLDSAFRPKQQQKRGHVRCHSFESGSDYHEEGRSVDTPILRADGDRRSSPPASPTRKNGGRKGATMTSTGRPTGPAKASSFPAAHTSKGKHHQNDTSAMLYDPSQNIHVHSSKSSQTKRNMEPSESFDSTDPYLNDYNRFGKYQVDMEGVPKKGWREKAAEDRYERGNRASFDSGNTSDSGAAHWRDDGDDQSEPDWDDNVEVCDLEANRDMIGFSEDASDCSLEMVHYNPRNTQMLTHADRVTVGREIRMAPLGLRRMGWRKASNKTTTKKVAKSKIKKPKTMTMTKSKKPEVQSEDYGKKPSSTEQFVLPDEQPQPTFLQRSLSFGRRKHHSVDDLPYPDDASSTSNESSLDRYLDDSLKMPKRHSLRHSLNQAPNDDWAPVAPRRRQKTNKNHSSPSNSSDMGSSYPRHATSMSPQKRQKSRRRHSTPSNHRTPESPTKKGIGRKFKKLFSL